MNNEQIISNDMIKRHHNATGSLVKTVRQIRWVMWITIRIIFPIFLVNICSDPSLTLLSTLKCLSIGTLKIINFPFVPNGKFMIFRCPKIKAEYSLITMCMNIGTPKNINFPFETNGKLMILGVPILKHFRVVLIRVHHVFIVN